jgi:hypothetical protein
VSVGPRGAPTSLLVRDRAAAALRGAWAGMQKPPDARVGVRGPGGAVAGLEAGAARRAGRPPARRVGPPAGLRPRRRGPCRHPRACRSRSWPRRRRRSRRWPRRRGAGWSRGDRPPSAAGRGVSTRRGAGAQVSRACRLDATTHMVASGENFALPRTRMRLGRRCPTRVAVASTGGRCSPRRAVRYTGACSAAAAPSQRRCPREKGSCETGRMLEAPKAGVAPTEVPVLLTEAGISSLEGVCGPARGPSRRPREPGGRPLGRHSSRRRSRSKGEPEAGR